MHFPGTPSLSSSAVEATLSQRDVAVALLSGRGSLSSREGSVSQASLTNDWSLLPSSFQRLRPSLFSFHSSSDRTQRSSLLLICSPLNEIGAYGPALNEKGGGTRKQGESVDLELF